MIHGPRLEFLPARTHAERRPRRSTRRLFAGCFPTVLTLHGRLVFACAVVLTICGETVARDLSTDLANLIGKSGLATSSVSVSVLDAATGDAIAEHRASAPMIPASNAKLLTTAAALDILGPSFEFRTRVELEETPEGTDCASSEAATRRLATRNSPPALRSWR